MCPNPWRTRPCALWETEFPCFPQEPPRVLPWDFALPPFPPLCFHVSCSVGPVRFEESSRHLIHGCVPGGLRDGAPFLARDESTCRPCDASTLARSPCKNTAVAMQRQLLFVFAATTAILMRFPTLTPLTKRITVGLLGQPTATADLSSLLRATGRPRSANQNATLIRRVSAAHLRSRRTVSNWSSTCCGAHPCASRRK